MPEGDKTGGSEGAHLRKLARKDPKLRARLLRPEYPHWIDYIRVYAQSLHGRSGVGTSGVAPLSPQTIESYARLKRLEFEPYEVDGLMAVDSAMLYPGDG